MRFVIIVFGIFFMFSACNRELDKPDDLIPEQQMKEIIKEIYLYRQVRNYKLAPDLPSPPLTNLAILEKYGVTLEQFKTSYQYYIIDNAAYDEFLEDIRNDLETELPEEAASGEKSANDRLLKAPPSR